MRILELITSQDGSLSAPKLAGATFHLLLAVTVGWVTWKAQDFRLDMWGFYMAAALGHVSFDKSLAVMQDLKTKRMDMTATIDTSAPAPTP